MYIIECQEELVVPLTKICRLSVSYGVFPAKWKSANIIPMFKKGDKKAAGNYRSFSLLPLFGKFLERAVYDQLFRHSAYSSCSMQGAARFRPETIVHQQLGCLSHPGVAGHIGGLSDWHRVHRFLCCVSECEPCLPDPQAGTLVPFTRPFRTILPDP